MAVTKILGQCASVLRRDSDVELHMLFQYIKLARHNIFLVTLLSNIEHSERACCEEIQSIKKLCRTKKHFPKQKEKFKVKI